MWDDLNGVRWAGLRHNCGAATDVPGLLRACAGSDRQDEDDQIRAAAAAYLTSRTTGQSG